MMIGVGGRRAGAGGGADVRGPARFRRVFRRAVRTWREKAEPGQRMRLGGLVVEGTLRRDADGAMHFAVTDGAVQVEVRYDGLLPDLFREGQGVVAEGTWTPGAAFEADARARASTMKTTCRAKSPKR